ncbi:MAG TPA: hypothetical protein VEJ63_08420 [Planctomycetota bacterium]|nr:hypothetical protein [Planctomycetota bacterium]
MSDRTLLDFSDASLWFSENQSPFEIVAGRQSAKALRARLTTKPEWSNVICDKVPPDWSTHPFLNLDVFVEGPHRALLGMWVKDTANRRDTRFFELEPGAQTISVRLAELNAEKTLLDLKHIKAICLFRGWPRWPAEVILRFENLRLSERDQSTMEPPPVTPETLKAHFQPPAELAHDFAGLKSPLIFNDGRRVKSPAEWPERRREILQTWHSIMGRWPAIIEKPAVETVATERREDFTQHTVRIAAGMRQPTNGYLLVPDKPAPRPAVLLVYYEPETAAGLKGITTRAFAYHLVKRGFIALSIGEQPITRNENYLRDDQEPFVQPLSYLAYVAANCCNALANMPSVDPARIGVMGHSYGGKWSMFASCLYEKFACGVWCDGGFIFDEACNNVNYWDACYLGREKGSLRPHCPLSEKHPRTGAYKTLIERGHNLHELHALMAPRPFLVSGGSEDFPARWPVLNHAIEVNRFLGYEGRVGMTNRAQHGPTETSNDQAFLFFETVLKP